MLQQVTDYLARREGIVGIMDQALNKVEGAGYLSKVGKFTQLEEKFVSMSS